MTPDPDLNPRPDAVAEARAGLERALSEAEDRITRLRARRSQINAEIRDLVTETETIRRVLGSFDGRRRRSAS